MTSPLVELDHRTYHNMREAKFRGKMHAKYKTLKKKKNLDGGQGCLPLNGLCVTPGYHKDKATQQKAKYKSHTAWALILKII